MTPVCTLTATRSTSSMRMMRTTEALSALPLNVRTAASIHKAPISTLKVLNPRASAWTMVKVPSPCRTPRALHAATQARQSKKAESPGTAAADRRKRTTTSGGDCDHLTNRVGCGFSPNRRRVFSRRSEKSSTSSNLSEEDTRAQKKLKELEDAFLQALNDIRDLVTRDSWPRFRDSRHYAPVISRPHPHLPQSTSHIFIVHLLNSSKRSTKVRLS